MIYAAHTANSVGVAKAAKYDSKVIEFRGSRHDAADGLGSRSPARPQCVSRKSRVSGFLGFVVHALSPVLPLDE